MDQSRNVGEWWEQAAFQENAIFKATGKQAGRQEDRQWIYQITKGERVILSLSLSLTPTGTMKDGKDGERAQYLPLRAFTS